MGRRNQRRAFTIMEMMIVLAVLILAGAVIVPSMSGYYGNSKQQAAADLFRTRLAEATAKAMERGIPFRLAVNSDMTRIRVAPDSDTFDSVQADDPPSFDSLATEDKLDEATLDFQHDLDDDRPASAGGWTTVVTMKASGGCVETRSSVLSIKDKNFPPIQFQIRAVMGTARLVKLPNSGGQP